MFKMSMRKLEAQKTTGLKKKKKSLQRKQKEVFSQVESQKHVSTEVRSLRQ